MSLILQEVLKEVLKEKLPGLANHFEEHTVDPSLFTLNWFLCVFVDTLPVKTYLHIWDAFLFEGNKVKVNLKTKVNSIPYEKLLVEQQFPLASMGEFGKLIQSAGQKQCLKFF